MLENQWFIFSSGSGEAAVDGGALPSNHRSHTTPGIHESLESIHGPSHGSIHGLGTLRHGPSVLVEEDEDTYALAIGDTRAL
ncbi:MAG: hypothetical protein WBF42_16940, partial [Terracidiphilus sp.]